MDPVVLTLFNFFWADIPNKVAAECLGICNLIYLLGITNRLYSCVYFWINLPLSQNEPCLIYALSCFSFCSRRRFLHSAPIKTRPAVRRDPAAVLQDVFSCKVYYCDSAECLGIRDCNAENKWKTRNVLLGSGETVKTGSWKFLWDDEMFAGWF